MHVAHGFPVAEPGFGHCEIYFAITAVGVLASHTLALGHTDAQDEHDPAVFSM